MTKIVLARPPRDDLELWWLIKAYFGVTLPNQQICPNHVSPFHAVAHAFFGRHPNYAVWYASRGSGKSEALAILGLIKSFVWDVDVTILGGSMTQSKNVAEHMAKLMASPNAPSYAMEKRTATELRLHTQRTIRPLPASQTTVRGPHPPLQLLDEVDEMEMDIYDASMGQAMEQINHWGHVVDEYIVASSTWQNPEGTFTEVIDRARRNGMPIFTWCWRELIKTPSNPSGWMSQRFIENKKKTVSASMWRTEYELNEPSGASRAFDLDQLDKTFVPYPAPVAIHDEGEDYRSYTWERPQPNGSYSVGADWAKERDFTVISVIRRDVFPYRMVKWTRIHRRPYPFMIELFNRDIQAYAAVGEHDKTGLGTVVSDLVDFSDSVRGFTMVGKDRTQLLTDYIVDVEHLHYALPSEDVLDEFEDDGVTPRKLPGLDWLKRSHRATTTADVFAPSKWDAHLPDEVASMALQHRALKRFAAPITEETGVARSDAIRKVDQQFHTVPYADGYTRQEGGVTVVDDRQDDKGVDLLVGSGRYAETDTGLWTPTY